MTTEPLYRVTFLCNVLGQIHYTSESPVRYFFYEKVVKWCITITDTSSEINASGGIAGRILGSITNSKAYDVTINTTRDVGGVAGAVTENGTIENCYVNDISIKATGAAGALVGSLVNATVSNCSAGGNLKLNGSWKHDANFGYILNVNWK